MKGLGFLLNNRAGALSMVAAVMFTGVCIGLLTLVIDTNKVFYASSTVQNALDNTAITTGLYLEKAGEEVSSDHIREFAKKHFINNLQSVSGFSGISPESDGFQSILLPGKLILKACVNVTPSFKKNQNSKVCSKTAVRYSVATRGLKGVEVAFAIDFSSSMSSKIESVKTSVKDIVSRYQSPSVYWAVVPYRGMVDIRPYQNVIVKDDLNDMVANVPDTLEGFKTMNMSNKSYYFPSGALSSSTDPIVKVYGLTTNVDKKLPRHSHLRTVPNDNQGSSFFIPLRKNSTETTVGFEKGYATGLVEEIFAGYDKNRNEVYVKSPAGGLYSLMSVPITERINGNEVFDDTRPEINGPLGDTRFKAYWHHDKKITFGMDFEYIQYTTTTPIGVQKPIPATTQCGRYLGGSGTAGGAGSSGG